MKIKTKLIVSNIPTLLAGITAFGFLIYLSLSNKMENYFFYIGIAGLFFTFVSFILVLFNASKFLVLFFFAAGTSWINASAQQLSITDFVIFGGNGNCSTCAVQLGSSSNIQGGSVGSYKLVKTTGNAAISGNIHSGGTVSLSNSNNVSGRITAANAYGA
ncbi:MAG TPA: hypothetical protein PK771_12415, partial [Spirochaetota bacterium]|nr:hypothetical protein [Spirochaetota bacterium]